MTLGPIDYVNGITSIIYFVTSIIIATVIILRYFKYKNVTLILFGLATIGLVWPFLSTILSFLTYIFTGSPLPDQVYFLIGNVLLPITTTVWFYAVIKVTHEGKEKMVSGLVFLLFIVLDIIYIILVFIRPEIIGKKLSEIDVEYIGYGLCYLVLALTFVWIGLTIFLRDVFKSISPEAKLKGKFLLIGLLTYTIASTFDGFLALDIPLLVLMRILLMISSFEFYIGWILPDPVKKLIMKEMLNLL